MLTRHRLHISILFKMSIRCWAILTFFFGFYIYDVAVRVKNCNVLFSASRPCSFRRRPAGLEFPYRVCCCFDSVLCVVVIIRAFSECVFFFIFTCDNCDGMVVLSDILYAVMSFMR